MKSLRPALRNTLLGFAILALIAWVLLSFGAGDTGKWFSWVIEPPLSAAALGAFYGAAFVLLFAASRAPSWAGARPIAYPVLVIAVVLLLVTLVHLDRFDLGRLPGVFWLCAYIAAPPLLVFGIADQRRHAPEERVSGAPLPPVLRTVLWVEAAVMFATACVMLLAPVTAADLWPWALTPLVSRALGAFTLGVSLVGAVVASENRVVLFRETAGAYLTLGVLQLLVLWRHSEDVGGDGLATGIYVAFLSAMAVTGLYGSIAARAFSRS